MESSYEEEVVVRRGISTTKADWQTSKAETINATSPKSERVGPAYGAGETSSSDSDDARKDLSGCSEDDTVCHRIHLDSTNCFLEPADDATEDQITLSLRGGQLDFDDADMLVEDTDSEIFEDDYAQGNQKSKFSQWLGTSSSKPKSEKPRSGFGLGRLWKSPAREQSTSCFFDQEKESKGLRYQNQNLAATAPKKLDSVEAMEKMNASLPSLNLRCPHHKN